jgi:LPPG:FO 2-phospho-L-lactate transferase
MRLTEATDELRRRLGLKTRVLPMTDDRVRTIFETDLGRLTFQEFFVREGSRPRVNRIEIAGAATARPAPEAAEAVADADLVVIGPSNPIISIAPVLALVGGFLTRHRTIAVTPLVAGKALKGPTVEMIKAVGGDPSVEGVAGSYRRSASWFVLDQRDAAAAPALAAMEYQVVVTDTVMEGPAGQRRLAEAILTALGERTLKA